MEISLQIHIRPEHGEQGYGDLSFSEAFRMEAANFQDLAGLMSRFHELFEEIRKAKEVHKR